MANLWRLRFADPKILADEFTRAAGEELSTLFGPEVARKVVDSINEHPSTFRALGGFHKVRATKAEAASLGISISEAARVSAAIRLGWLWAAQSRWATISRSPNHHSDDKRMPVLWKDAACLFVDRSIAPPGFINLVGLDKDDNITAVRHFSGRRNNTDAFLRKDRDLFQLLTKRKPKGVAFVAIASARERFENLDEREIAFAIALKGEAERRGIRFRDYVIFNQERSENDRVSFTDLGLLSADPLRGPPAPA